MYKLTNHTTIVRLADNASIPADPANRDYAEYLEWLANGNTPQPAQTLGEIKAEKLVELKRLRDAAETANVTVNGKTFSASAEVQTGFKRLADRIRRGKPSFLTAIYQVDGTPVHGVNQTLLDGIEDAVAANTENAWNRYGHLIAQVAAATTPEEVSSIVW